MRRNTLTALLAPLGFLVVDPAFAAKAANAPGDANASFRTVSVWQIIYRLMQPWQ